MNALTKVASISSWEQNETASTSEMLEETNMSEHETMTDKGKWRIVSQAEMKGNPKAKTS
jgi:hypothetical protein